MLIDSVTVVEGSSITNAVLPTGTSFPQDPNIGEIFYKTGSSAGVYSFDGSSWIALGGGTSGGNVTTISLGLENVDNTSDLDKPISILTQAALDTKVNYTDIGIVTIKNVDGSYALVQADLTNTLVRVNSPIGQTATVTIPTDATADCSIGSTVTIASAGYGQVVFVAEVGATIGSPQSLIIDRKYGRVTLIKVAANTWEVDGQLVAQAQFAINPINSTPIFWDTFLSDALPVSGSTQIISTLSVQHDLDVYLSQNFYDLIPSQIPKVEFWNGGGTPGSTYVNTIPTNMYFKAVVTSGPGTIVDAATDILDPSGSWLWFTPHVSSGQWVQLLAGQPLPNWCMIQTLTDLETPTVVTISVADLPSDASILGSFTVAIVKPNVAHLVDDFTGGAMVSFPSFSFNQDGWLLDDAANPLFSIVDPVFAGQYPWMNLHVKVTLPNGPISNFTGTGELDVLYTGGSLSTWYTWGIVSDGNPVTFQIEIYSNPNGTMELFSTSQITLQ